MLPSRCTAPLRAAAAAGRRKLGRGKKGAGAWAHRMSHGLYGNRRIQYGNNVSHSERKTRRRWLPNVHKATMYSAVLQRYIRLPVTSRELRTIDKYGGLDSYLIYSNPKNLGTGLALELRAEIRQAAAPQLREERRVRNRIFWAQAEKHAQQEDKDTAP